MMSQLAMVSDYLHALSKLESARQMSLIIIAQIVWFIVSLLFCVSVHHDDT